MSDLIRNEVAHAIAGVPGRFMPLRIPPAPWIAGVFANQTWISESRPVSGYGKGAVLQVEMRFDDNCKNRRMSFAITGEVRVPRQRDVAACGCLHDEIASVFPELAHLIKWHLCATDGPMHYLANTLHFAGDADCQGLRNGEQKPIMARDGIPHWELVAINCLGVAISTTPTGLKYQGASHVPLFIIEKDYKGETPPATPKLEWRQQMITGEGKARELGSARIAACWPDATDEQLCLPRDELRALLVARLPALLADFRADMEAIGFLWECPIEVGV